MCIICISKAGKRQPTKKELETMFKNNPDGCGYMFARGGKVYIHKGFMKFKDFARSLADDHLTDAEPTVYHFRIATQAGINPYMTHPFLLTNDLDKTKVLDAVAPIGIVHNGIIKMTSDGDKEFSDTAKFITSYLVKIVRRQSDLRDSAILEIIEELTKSKLAFLDKSGFIATVGKFIEDNDLLFSNGTYKPYAYKPAFPYREQTHLKGVVDYDKRVFYLEK